MTLKFRLFAIMIKADIAKLYRQIDVIPEQRKLQLILWREDPSQPVKTFALKTITYGTASASFQATRCLKQLAIEAKEDHPEKAEAVEKDFYMEYLLTGASTVQQAINKFKIIDGITASSQMNLRKVEMLKFGRNKKSQTTARIDSRQSCM
jgi:hypothetical protein